jgi:hypothetical protein
MFELNLKPTKRVFVVDDFYANPNEVREFALNDCQYTPSEWYKGNRSLNRYINDDIKTAFESILGHKITRWEHHGMNGRFQFCTPQDPLVYHVDGQNWAAIVYLTPNAPYDTGTSLYAHKASGCRDIYESEAKKIDCFTGGFFDSTKFEEVDMIGNVYNRLIIFNSRSFHAATKYFGQTAYDSRLFHIFFFD